MITDEEKLLYVERRLKEFNNQFIPLIARIVDLVSPYNEDEQMEGIYIPAFRDGKYEELATNLAYLDHNIQTTKRILNSLEEK